MSMTYVLISTNAVANVPSDSSAIQKETEDSNTGLANEQIRIQR
jgi:hypothetical protein